MAIGGVTGMAGARSFDTAQFAARMVKELDSNGDGALSEAEFTAGLTAKGVSAAAAADRFDSIDTKGTGKISQADIASAIKAPGGKGQRPGGSPPGGGPSRGGAAQAGGSAKSNGETTYDPADTNQDGTVSTVEAVIYSFKHAAAAITKAANAGQQRAGNTLDVTA